MRARRWTHDAVVIGAGAAGLTAAGGCARLGLRVALVERDRMGGECLHTGCVPSKALLAAAHRAAAMRGTAMGVSGAAVVDFPAVMAHVRGAIAAIAPHDAAERFEAWGVEVIRGEARFTGRRSVAVGERELRAPRVVIATGSSPAVPAIAGLADGPFLTNETLWGLRALPGHLVVLGGGAVGVEMAQAFARLGSAVSLIEAGALLARDDAEAVALVRDALRQDGVAVWEHSQAVRVGWDGGAVWVERAAGGRIAGTHLLVATGRRARVEALDLARAGVAAGPDGIVVDAARRTSNPGVFAIGDCRAGPRFTHAAGYEGALMVQRIALGLGGAARYDALPSVAYGAPELAQLGATEAAARERYRRVTAWREEFAGNDRAVAEASTAGFVKCVRAGRRLVGVTIVGPHAGELLLPWCLVLGGRGSLWGMSGVVAPYPTLSEASKAAAFARYEPVLFGRAARGWARLNRMRLRLARELR